MSSSLIFRHALLPTGWAEHVRLVFENGVITGVIPGQSGGQGIALPGMPNLHSHVFQRAFAGLTERRGPGADSFWTWRELMYRFANALTPDDLEAVALHGYIEMLERGFTHVAEFHYLHNAPDGTPYANPAEMSARLAAAAAQAGIGLLLLPVFYAHGGFGGQPPGPAQRRFLTSLDRYAEIVAACEALAPTGLAPHSLRAVTPDELAHLAALAGARPVHIHIAEQTAEVEACLAWCGQRPVEHLLATAPAGPNWCLVHATHVTPAELTAMAERGVVAGLCPITEANLGDGIFPAANFTGGFGIGSDSNVLIDPFAELQLLEYSQRLGVRARNVMASPSFPATATALWARASAGGAQALGIGPGLTPGAPASFVVLPSAQPPDIALSQAVFAPRTGMIEQVWSGGVQQVAGGAHRLASKARARFEAVVDKLM
ncbi:formimidoylglutamate deiminase [Acidocella sp.]|uniref:formimidoylglutamate deiminase n=1 Tax=Acidocella sp. TaxID=50710 RepID=UPI0026030740|nr:formimidoylglutamate deiminase [Acidocella sp.]